MEVESGQLGITSFMLGGQHVGNPFTINLLVFSFEQIVEARISIVLMNGYVYQTVHLFMNIAICLVMIIKNNKFFVRVVDDSKGIVFDVAYTNMNRTCSASIS